MSIDAPTLPVGGAAVLAALGYAAVSAFITGPEIASREIARSDWQEVCETSLLAEIEATRRPDQLIPDAPDLGGMLCSVYPEMRDLCAMIPDPMAQAREIEKRRRAAEDARIRRVAEGMTDRCTCAVAVYAEDRLSLALYAGSGRLITPNAVKNRETALMRALNSPSCSFGREDKS
ncbi:hypothetical protein [Leisingera aquaemixtae]|uniref:Uncharacterized protein n=1 Tax=Leisingera aquaemixtae TaxID=1396826 RepID=A0A0P1HEE8_9RHOB|nr:hypothetical protein [Leisingera aquaemixtae]CUI01871.1 hypothetical protein PHA8399_04020 [Leisingera aquaemixtae]